MLQVRADQGVPELAGGPGCPPVHAPVQHEPAADARPDRDHHEVLDDHAGAVVGFREGRAVRVVVHEHRKAEPLFENRPQRDVRELHVHAPLHSAGRELDHRRDPDADGRRLPAANGFDRAGDLVDQRVGTRRRGREDLWRASSRLPCRVADRELGPADVDADQLPAHPFNSASARAASRAATLAGIVEQDDVGGASRAKAGGEPERRRGHLAGGRDRLCRARLSVIDVQLRTAASSVSALPGEAALRGSHDAGVSALDLDARQPVTARRRGGGRRGVADQDHPRACRPPDELEHERIDVQPVGDDADQRAGIRERDPGEAGRAVMEWGHGVEHVGDEAARRRRGRAGRRPPMRPSDPARRPRRARAAPRSGPAPRAAPARA